MVDCTMEGKDGGGVVESRHSKNSGCQWPILTILDVCRGVKIRILKLLTATEVCPFSFHWFLQSGNQQKPAETTKPRNLEIQFPETSQGVEQQNPKKLWKLPVTHNKYKWLENIRSSMLRFLGFLVALARKRKY